MNLEKTKLCWSCSQTLPISLFSKNSKRRDGLQDRCKQCSKTDYEKNREKRRKQMKEYQANNKDKTKVYRQANKDAYALNHIKDRAKRKGLEFKLELADIVPPDYCPILKLKLERSEGFGPKNSSPSVDRIDSTKGYTKDNIQVISNLANRMKTDATPEQLLMFAEWVFKTYRIEEGKKYDVEDSSSLPKPSV